ncbi:dihydrolipoamide acetyltransferase [Lysobacter concretionis Ko07 = DSM 16239]|uniref:Dihydrolipoamide acetyltransferase component of pyruvate dehydrogenase complex n=2 Tax=Novilysobacter TaxID=3382699 RepID=A0A0A0ELI7_9GAMM|nr:MULTISPECIES: dihydrolipoyllysine-residue acetyltransferase [Lysobacter]KGM51165.1 dihydrolipoamide acetyltransferase [Lysobacter concretionis Ko07 = DSM 16239]QOD90848.1 dihydrolipoyllysine-residue acetyltransferase [Lysobacter sp. CW239]
MAELKEARVPDIGGYDGVPVIEVLVAVGDTVQVDQGLVTLESDKATMEVPAPFAGVVRELKVKLGDEIAEGSVVALIEPSADAAAGPAAAAAEPAEPSRVEPARAEPARAEPVAASQETRAVETATQVEPTAVGTPDRLAQRETAAATSPSSPPVVFDASELLPGKVPYASPAVRLFARELGVDLMQVAGSQRGGRIGKEDVQKFVKDAMQGGGAVAAAGSGNGLSLLPWPKVDFSKFGPTETRALSRIQKISGANLARNWAMIPHVTQFEDADITGLEALRVQLNRENEKLIAKGKATKLTMLAFLMKAAANALQKFPDFNASLDADGETLVLKQYFHIGFAADTPNGLVVPVVRDCDRKGVMEIAMETGELAAKAREGKLGPAQMSGGCFSISSLGGIGGTKFTPIVNAPEVAILGVSRAAMQPVWNGEKFKPRLILPLSLSYDHRVIDGAAAARFAVYLAQALADMRRLLL